MYDNYITYLFGNQASMNTIKAYRKSIEDMLSYVNKSETEITYEDLVNWKCSIAHYSSASMAQKIAAVKDYFKYLHIAHIIDENPALYLKTVRVKNAEKTPLSGEQIRAMINATNVMRNKAIIMTLATTCMRISELNSITLYQYQHRINDSIIITGKGDKERRIKFDPETISYIDAYLETRKNTNCDLLFVSNHGTKMNPQCTADMLKMCAKKAGIENWEDMHICNHLMRTSGATIKYHNGVDIEVLQNILGHSNIDTTIKHYVKNINDKAMDVMSVAGF